MNLPITIYAFLLLIGGMIGYFTANSLPSLIMGTSFSLIFAVLSLQTGKIASFVTLALASLMALFFSYRFFLTQKFLPAGLMCIASIALVLWLLNKFRFVKTYSNEKLAKCPITINQEKK